VATSLINGGDLLAIDGETGEVVINPTEELCRLFLERKRKIRTIERGILKYASLPAETLDGIRVRLQANIEMLDEIPSAKAHGADGIGLFRTEILYLNRKDLPSEEEHYQTYKKAAEEVFPASVTIRTLDIGGDKFIPNYSKGNEINPALGLRAIRFSIKEPDIFRTQLRGILRASAHGKIKILLPMISGVDEIRQTKNILEEIKRGFRRSKIPFDPNIEIGAMIEIPSASVIIDLLSQEVNFFSIGTNDLIQYSLAIDRVNEHVSYLYQPLHPSILRIINSIVQSANKSNIPVAICGEMAADPIHIIVLLGLGLKEFSMNPVAIPKAKRIIRNIRFDEVKGFVNGLFGIPTASEIEKVVRDWISRRFPVGFLL